MFLHCFPSGPLSTNAYLFACLSTREAAVIDPALGSAEVIRHMAKENDFRIRKVILTHSHWDHIADATLFQKEEGALLYLHPLDLPNLLSPGADGLPYPHVIPPASADHLIEEGASISVGHLQLQVIHTPGHSPGSICLYEPTHFLLFSGDTLFHGTIGKLSFPTSQPSLMQSSLNKLARLPSHTSVLPGHGPETTMGEESWITRANALFGF